MSRDSGSEGSGFRPRGRACDARLGHGVILGGRAPARAAVGRPRRAALVTTTTDGNSSELTLRAQLGGLWVAGVTAERNGRDAQSQ